MTAIQYAYLGKPGAMRQLLIPRKGWEASPTLSDSVHTLLSGGTAAVRNLYPKRTWPVNADVTADVADLILGFYFGNFGLGPFRFVDPTQRNMLKLDVATCGMRVQAAHGWIQSTGTLTRTGTAPAGVDTGVLQWGTLAASATLQPGAAANTADINTAPVYIPAEAVTVSLYAMANASSSGHTLQLVGYNAAGAATVTTATTSMSLTTSWQRFTVTIAANAAAYASAVYVLPRIVLGGTVPTTVSIAGAQVEYGDTVSAFQLGYGCPTVTIAGTPGRSVTAPGWRGHALTLAEI